MAMSIAEILHKRPFQTAATLITLCKGQSKGKMMRAVTVDTQCTNGRGQIVEERGGAPRGLQAHFGTQTYGKLFATNGGHHRTAQTIQSHPKRHRSARSVGRCYDICSFVCFLQLFLAVSLYRKESNNLTLNMFHFLRSRCT